MQFSYLNKEYDVMWGYLPQSVVTLPLPVGGRVVDGFYEAGLYNSLWTSSFSKQNMWNILKSILFWISFENEVWKELIALAFPLVFIVAFLYTQKKVLNELIAEKETKVRESLRMLGVRSLAIISSLVFYTKKHYI